MPVSKSNIPRQQNLPEINSDVGLNVPRALEPVEVVPSDNGGPDVIQTILGWSINGLLCTGGAHCEQPGITTNHISTTSNCCFHSSSSLTAECIRMNSWVHQGKIITSWKRSKTLLS